MNNMMSNLGGIPAMWHVHIIFVLSIILGLVFLVLWANKSLTKNQLLYWTIGLLILGALGMFLTAEWGFKGMEYMMNNMNFNNLKP